MSASGIRPARPGGVRGGGAVGGARALALAFGAGHAVVSLAAVAAPAAVRPLLGRRAPSGLALRALAAADALPALAVADAALRGRPLRPRLAVGIGGDLARAAACRAWGARAVPAYSLAGAATAVALLPRVDRARTVSPAPRRGARRRG